MEDLIFIKMHTDEDTALLVHRKISLITEPYERKNSLSLTSYTRVEDLFNTPCYRIQ